MWFAIDSKGSFCEQSTLEILSPSRNLSRAKHGREFMFKATISSKTLLSFFAISTILSSSAYAAAITTSQVPGSARPERATERLRDEDRPEVGGTPIIEAAPEKEQVKIAGGAKFTLKAVKFEGISGVNEQDLQAVANGKIGEKVTLGDLRALTAKMTAELRNKGYILSRAVLPPQTVNNDGVVKVKIVEGFVNNVSFTGDAVKDSSLLNRMADKIRNSKPLQAADLERYLLLMEDLPGVSARATIQPAAGVPGASDIVVKITQKPIDASLTADNRGSRFLGQYQGSASVSFNNAFGTYDRTSARIVSSFNDELKYGELVHEEQIGTEGTKAVFSGSFSDSNVGHTLEDFDIEGQTRTFTAAVRHPFLRSRQTNLYGILEAAVRDTDVTTLDDRLYNDRTRTLKATASYDFVDRWQAVNKTDFSVMQGFGIFDDDPAGGIRSRVDGETNFTKLNAYISRLQTISGPFSLLTTATGQWSFDPLLASEEFGLGGEEFASAYDPSEVTGDQGVAGRIELQYNQYPSYKYLDYYQLYTYYDAGKVWNRGNISPDDSIPLTSAGLGVRFNALSSVSGSLDFTVPINRPVAANGLDGDAPRVFFSLAYRY